MWPAIDLESVNASISVGCLQVQFPPSIYSTAADKYKSLLTSNIAAAFSSDASFYSTYGPATAAASSYAEGFAFVSPPPPPSATALPPPPPFTLPPPGSVHPPPPPTAAVASSPPPPVFILALQCVWRSSKCGFVHGLDLVGTPHAVNPVPSHPVTRQTACWHTLPLKQYSLKHFA